MQGTARLIAFEGPDGAGKTTLLNQVASELTRLNIDYIHVRNPGGTPTGEKIRNLLLDPSVSMVTMTEVHLFIASRIQLIEEVVRPALKEGKVVLCDRLDLSTLFYQSAGYKWSLLRKYGKEADLEQVLAFHERLKKLSDGTLDDVPHRYLILDASDKILNERRPPNNADRFEMREETFQKDVRAYYRQYVENNKWKMNVKVQKTDSPTTAEEMTEIIGWMTESVTMMSQNTA